MTLPYENATSGERALGEIQKLLRGFGCNKFGSMIDDSLDDARALLSQYADEIRDSETLGTGEWPEAAQDARRLHDRIMAAIAGMTELERLL